MPKKPDDPVDRKSTESRSQGSGVWRVGKKVPINVYQDDRPVCQCHTVVDAQRIVAAMNVAEAMAAGLALFPPQASAEGDGLAKASTSDAEGPKASERPEFPGGPGSEVW